MTRYAQQTTVSVERSRSEIEELIVRYGATSTAFMNGPGRAMILFECKGRRIMFELPLPDIEEKQFQRDGRGSLRNMDKRRVVWEQACRQRWRALALVIKAKLEAVESGITSFEQEFYAHIVMPGGISLYEATKDGVELAYKSGKIQPLLPNYSGERQEKPRP